MNDQEPAAEAAVRAAGDRWVIAAARRTGLELRRRPGDVDRFAGALLAELADRLDGRPAAQAGRCGDHHASGVTSCTRAAGHDGAHHNGSGLTWGSEPAAAQDTEGSHG